MQYKAQKLVHLVVDLQLYITFNVIMENRIRSKALFPYEST